MLFGMEVNLGLGDFVLDEDPALPSLKTRAQFLAFVCCGETGGWIKMLFAAKVGLRSRCVVLDRDPGSPPPKKGHSCLSTNFRPMFIVAKRLDSSGYHLVCR